MPNKSSRIVNGLDERHSLPGFFGVLVQGLCVFLSAVLMLVTGGLVSPAIGLILLVPVLFSVWKGWTYARPAILSACMALIVLGAMAVFGLVPPPYAPVMDYLGWLILGLLGLALLLMLLARERPVEGKGGRREADRPSSGSPFLVVGLSPYGRIRELHGDASLLPGVKVGKELTPLLRITGIEPILRQTGEHGETLIFAPEAATHPHTNEDLFEDISGLSHDLKAPLTSILGFSQMMRDRELGDNPKLYADYPGLIHTSAEGLQQRVEQLLELLKAESGRLELEPERVMIAPTVEQVFSALSPLAGAGDVALTKDILPQTAAFADAAAYQRILENLISNAVKYTKPGGSVIVTAETYQGQVITAVTDQGTGISGGDLEALAAPFVQASHTGSREGTGLGLALVKRLVALQGGEFTIRTAKGRGTQMIVKLPAYAGQDTVRAAE